MLVFADLSNLFAINSRVVHMFLILFVLLLCWRCCQGVHLHRAVVSLPFRRFAFTSRRRRIAVHDTVRAALATRAAAAPPTVHGEVGGGGGWAILFGGQHVCTSVGGRGFDHSSDGPGGGGHGTSVGRETPYTENRVVAFRQTSSGGSGGGGVRTLRRISQDLITKWTLKNEQAML